MTHPGQVTMFLRREEHKRRAVSVTFHAIIMTADNDTAPEGKKISICVNHKPGIKLDEKVQNSGNTVFIQVVIQDLKMNCSLEISAHSKKMKILKYFVFEWEFGYEKFNSRLIDNNRFGGISHCTISLRENDMDEN